MSNDTKNPTLGIAYMLLAMCLVPGIDICGKLLSQSYDVISLTWQRYMMHVIWMLPVFWLGRGKVPLWPRRPRDQILRGLFLVSTTVLFFLAIRDNPIPNALILIFIAPLVVTLSSPFFLGEQLGWHRILSALIGFIGILIVIDPQSGSFQPSLLFAIAGGFCFAGYLLSTRSLGRKSRNEDSALDTLFFTGLIGIAVTTPFIFQNWVTPQGIEWIYIILMGFFAAFGHYFIILAGQQAQASLIAPFIYFEIITASLYNFLIFDYIANERFWLGAAIICGSGIYISLRERKKQRPLRRSERM